MNTPWRRRLAAACSSLLLASASGCSLVSELAFLKPAVNNAPQGRRSTDRGPAFDAPFARTSIDSSADWATYNNTFSGTRFSPLTQITAQNAASLHPICTARLDEAAVMESGPIVVAGTMYVTSAVATWAIDANNCAIRWKHRYAYHPAPDFDLKTNRGVAYLDMPGGPRLFRGSNDGRIYALDARTGEELWNVRAGDVSRGETFPAAPIAWHGLVFMGNAGGDNYGVTGRMMAFDARTGARVWSTELVPRSGAADTTWPAETNDVPRGGGTTWTSYSLDTLQHLLYVSTGNAAPDFLAQVRKGSDAYAYSIVVIDAQTGDIRNAYQVLNTDFHDWDLAAAPLLIALPRGGRLVAAAGKDGHLYGIDPASGVIRYKTPVTTIENADAPLTHAGTHFCPGIQGGVEWNGPAYLPATNMLYVGAVDWCSTVKVEAPEKLKGKMGIPWTGSAKLTEPFGKFDPKASWKGWITAVDASSGAVRWKYQAPTPIVAGVTTTAGGVVFAGDLLGDVFGFDAATGEICFRYNTGQPIGGGIISYSVNGQQRIAVASGMDAPKAWQVKSGKSTIVVLGLR